jgi:hypothetical protein
MRAPDLAATTNGGDIHFGADGYLYWSMVTAATRTIRTVSPNACGKNPPTTTSLLPAMPPSPARHQLLHAGQDPAHGCRQSRRSATAEMCGSIGINPAQ